MTSESNCITRVAEELVQCFDVSAEEALDIISWSQYYFPNGWKVYAGAVGELTSIGNGVEQMLEWDEATLRWECLLNGVWLPEIITQDDLEVR